ncbi:MAG: hydroxymethylbilane synthase [Nitrospiria bacterium]
MEKQTIRIGSRGSKLALWQAEWVQSQLQSQGIAVEIQIIKTKGDKILDVPLAKVGGKGLFVKEIEDAFLGNEIDLAVHSMKDMPGEMPEGLQIGAIPEREDPRDAVIAREGVSLDALPEGACVGTSSLRRQAQLLALRPDFKIVSLRGNIDTRLRKLKAGAFDAILLAAAGLRRLGWGDEITETLAPRRFLPAIAQGALCIQTRTDDAKTNSLIRFLNHPETAAAVTAERAMLARLEGGCQVPIAGHATLSGDQILLEGWVASLDGKEIIRESRRAPVSGAAALGVSVAESLLEKGAAPILAAIYSAGSGGA